MAERHAECPVDGWKFYPTNSLIDPVTNNVYSALFDNRGLAFPSFEQARALGVPRVAVHKALPVGPGPLDNVHDVSTAAVAFPDVQFEVAYEDVVTRFEPTTRQLIEALGLPFEAACLEFHVNPAPVNTKSAVQVRKPLYRSSLDRWRCHADKLAPLRSRLEAAGIPIETPIERART